jgi:dephospho-CoA kinase
MGNIQTDLATGLVNDARYVEAFKGMTIYGVAGSNASGKDTVMELLEEYGFVHFNTSNALRRIAHAVFKSTDRGGNQEPMGVVGNAFRVAYPGGMVDVGLIDWLMQAGVMPEELRPRGLVIGSIRGTGEAQRLKEVGGKLIVTDADPKLRYERIMSRKRADDKVSFEEFMEHEKADMAPGQTDPTKFGMAAVMEMADIRIVTDSNDLDAFRAKVIETLGL